MMVVGTVEVVDMQRDAAVLGQRLEELADEFGVECADLRCCERSAPDEKRPPGDVDGGTCQRFVHGEVE